MGGSEFVAFFCFLVAAAIIVALLGVIFGWWYGPLAPCKDSTNCSPGLVCNHNGENANIDKKKGVCQILYGRAWSGDQCVSGKRDADGMCDEGEEDDCESFQELIFHNCIQLEWQPPTEQYR